MSYEEDERNYETPSMVTHVDPYVYATLQSVQGKDVVIAAKGSTFFVRIQQIVWIMPE